MSPKKQTASSRPKSSTGVVVGSGNRRPNFLAPVGRHKKIILLALGVIIVVVVLLILLWPKPKTYNGHSATTVATLLGKNNDKDTQTYLVKQFSVEYTTDYQQVESSNPAKWDKTMLNKAYLCLLYADKISAFSQVREMLFYIKAAGSSGLNINDNAFGIDQAARTAIQDRATAAAQPQLNNGKKNSNE